jgi:dipeptidase
MATLMTGMVSPTIGASLACDAWVALPDATADGSVIMAKNSDRPPMEAQPLVHVRRQTHEPGERVKCTYIEIPQVAETYEHIGSKIWWAFGYEHGMNEHGVTIGNEAVWSKEPYQWGDGLLGMDLLRLGLERARTAHEALRVVVTLLETYGQCGDCERAGEWGKANYHNSFIIADLKEAWILETAGKYWVAKRITQGVYSISNIYTIETEWDEAHPSLVAHAVEQGWTKSPKDFNFARDYGDYWRADSSDPGQSQLRRNQTLACLRRDAGNITPASMMRINRSHHEGTIVEPRWSPAETFWPSPCMHDNPRSKYHTAASIVAHLRPDLPPLLRQVYWASFSNPCCSVFKPFYLNGPTVPERYSAGASTYSAESAWWRANRIRLLCSLNYPPLNHSVRATFDRTEQWQMERQESCEAQALRLIAQGDRTAAVTCVQQFIDENCARVDTECATLNRTLAEKVKTVGVRYVFADYLRSWTATSKVPLPLGE